jgi:hypothetical protein
MISLDYASTFELGPFSANIDVNVAMCYVLLDLLLVSSIMYNINIIIVVAAVAVCHEIINYGIVVAAVCHVITVSTNS